MKLPAHWARAVLRPIWNRLAGDQIARGVLAVADLISLTNRTGLTVPTATGTRRRRAVVGTSRRLAIR